MSGPNFRISYPKMNFNQLEAEEKVVDDLINSENMMFIQKIKLDEGRLLM